MATSRTIVSLTTICGVFFLCHPASGAEQTSDPNAAKATTATIELTSLDVNDSTLKLNYKIRNDSDHEVWVCSDIGWVPLEIYLTQDRETLLIRKRLYVPNDGIRVAGPWGMPIGKYTRLKSGESHAEQLLINLPVKPVFEFAAPDKDEVVQIVKRLAIEIGYYDEDLPALIHSILKVADLFTIVGRGPALDARIVGTYFPGLAVKSALAGFDTTNKDPYGLGTARINYSQSRCEQCFHSLQRACSGTEFARRVGHREVSGREPEMGGRGA
jgi:hypothetical protein